MILQLCGRLTEFFSALMRDTDLPPATERQLTQSVPVNPQCSSRGSRCIKHRKKTGKFW
jgi:hypothetical protein